MLGSMVARVLSQDDSLTIVTSTRRSGPGSLAFDVSHDSIDELLKVADCEWIINAIGILDRHIDANDPKSVARAIEVNGSFPSRLASAAGDWRRLIHISTDGVFAGRDAPYDERSPHDGPGVYAYSKSLGEVGAHNVVNLRCSLVGPENPPPTSLLGWVLSQPPGATVTGYTNHFWNGITTLHFAKLCQAVILAGAHDLPPLLNVIPGDVVTKADLLRLGLAAFGREDVTVRAQPAEVPMDRTLGTCFPEVNRRLWEAAGYPAPPTIAQMIRELAWLES